MHTEALSGEGGFAGRDAFSGVVEGGGSSAGLCFEVMMRGVAVDGFEAG